MNENCVPVFLHIPKCAGTYVIGWNMLMMRYYGPLNGWNDAPGWSGALKIVDVVDDGRIVMRAFVWLKKECPWREVGTNGAVASIEELKRELPSCGVLFSIVVESRGFRLLRKGAYEGVCAIVGRRPAYYTILREPLDRAMSLYYYLKSQRSLHEPSRRKVISETFAEHIFNEMSDDWITRAIAGVSDDAGIEEDDATYVEEFLSKSIVGAMGDVDNVLSKVFKLCYGVIVNDVPREWIKDVNPNSGNKESICRLGDDEMEVFNHRTQHDAYLYAKFSKPLIVQNQLNNIVICYYEQFGSKFSKDSEQFLEVWQRSWKNNGWNAIVLCERDARQNPLYGQIDIDNPDANFYKTDNSKWMYHRSCYLRLLAYCQYVRMNGAALYADYDVINYSFTPDVLNFMSEDSVLKGERCAVYLGKRGALDIERAIARFNRDPGEISHSLKDENSSSDMHVISRFTTVFKTITCNLITKERSEKNNTYYCQNAGEDGYMDSPLVHFDGGVYGRNIRDEYKNLSRAELVQKLRPISKVDSMK